MHAQRGRGGRVGWNGYGPTDYLPPSQVRSPLSAFRPRSMDVPLPFLPSPRRSKTKHTSLASTWIWTWTLTWTWTAAPGIRCDGAAPRSMNWTGMYCTCTVHPARGSPDLNTSVPCAWLVSVHWNQMPCAAREEVLLSGMDPE